MSASRFNNASPYQKDALALPVSDIDAASQWYCDHCGMEEVERHESPVGRVVLERDSVRLGFACNGLDPSQDGAAIGVTNIEASRKELENNGVQVGDWRIDERDGERFQVFFVVAPDGLCFYFNELIEA